MVRGVHEVPSLYKSLAGEAISHCSEARPVPTIRRRYDYYAALTQEDSGNVRS